MLSVNNSRCLGNLDKEEEAEGISSEACQLSSIRDGNVGSVNHICSNLKDLGSLDSEGSVFNNIGQWSDLTLGRWCISVEGKSNVQSALPKPLSNRSFMVACQIGLLFVHVNRGP